MKVSTKIWAAFLLLVFVYGAPAEAVNATGDGSFLILVDMVDSTIKNDDGTFTINIYNASELTGDLTKNGTAGTLAVSMDNGSRVVGTATADGAGNILAIYDGSIRAAAGTDTLRAENGGTITLSGTTAGSNLGNLISSSTGGTVSASGSALNGDVVHTGAGALGISLDNSELIGNITNTGSGGGDLDIEMTGGGSITGTVKSDSPSVGQLGNYITLTGGSVTAAAGDNTLELNGGSMLLVGTQAGANGGSLIYSANNGGLYANNSTLIGDITFEGEGGLRITLDDDGDGGSTLTGNIFNTGTGGGGWIDLYLENNSSFTGNATTDADKETNIFIMKAGSSWTVTDDTDLGLGDLDNAGIVDFKTNAAYMTVKAGNLGFNGATGGLFDMKMDIMAMDSDKLEIADTARGSYTITAQDNDGSATASGKESFNLVEIGGDSTANFALTNDVELGAWRYSLRQIAYGTGSAFQVYSNGLSNAASAAVNTVAGGYLMGYAEMNTLIQRLGELRDTPMQNGFWARLHGAKFNTDGMRFGKEFDLDYGGVQIGYDRKIATEWEGDLYAGVMFGYGKGDIDFAYAGGGGDVDSKTIGVYGTYKQKDGLYIDAVLRYQWIDYEFDTFDSVGTKVTANDIDSGGFGLSIEAGKRFELRNGWYAEPQAQLSYLKQDGGTFNMSNGLRVAVSDWTSLLGRLGARVGYESGAHNFYAKLSWVKEFDGDLDFRANGSSFSDSFDDNWWVYGIGYASKINDKNSIYMDIERASGGVFEQDWSIRAGWRIAF